MQMAISPEIFSALKQANPVRYDILRHLFCSVGVDTEPEPLPDFTPAYMIAHKQVESTVVTVYLELEGGALLQTYLELWKLGHCGNRTWDWEAGRMGTKATVPGTGKRAGRALRQPYLRLGSVKAGH